MVLSSIYKFLERILSELPELGEIRVAAVGPCQLPLNRYGRIVAGNCYVEFCCYTHLVESQDENKASACSKATVTSF